MPISLTRLVVLAIDQFVLEFPIIGDFVRVDCYGALRTPHFPCTYSKLWLRECISFVLTKAEDFNPDWLHDAAMARLTPRVGGAI